jgi:hypothetical protein
MLLNMKSLCFFRSRRPFKLYKSTQQILDAGRNTVHASFIAHASAVDAVVLQQNSDPGPGSLAPVGTSYGFIAQDFAARSVDLLSVLVNVPPLQVAHIATYLCRAMTNPLRACSELVCC